MTPSTFTPEQLLQEIRTYLEQAKSTVQQAIESPPPVENNGHQWIFFPHNDQFYLFDAATFEQSTQNMLQNITELLNKFDQKHGPRLVKGLRGSYSGDLNNVLSRILHDTAHPPKQSGLSGAMNWLKNRNCFDPEKYIGNVRAGIIAVFDGFRPNTAMETMFGRKELRMPKPIPAHHIPEGAMDVAHVPDALKATLEKCLKDVSAVDTSALGADEKLLVAGDFARVYSGGEENQVFVYKQEIDNLKINLGRYLDQFDSCKPRLIEGFVSGPRELDCVVARVNIDEVAQMGLFRARTAPETLSMSAMTYAMHREIGKSTEKLSLTRFFKRTPKVPSVAAEAAVESEAKTTWLSRQWTKSKAFGQKILGQLTSLGDPTHEVPVINPLPTEPNEINGVTTVVNANSTVPTVAAQVSAASSVVPEQLPPAAESLGQSTPPAAETTSWLKRMGETMAEHKGKLAIIGGTVALGGVAYGLYRHKVKSERHEAAKGLPEMAQR